ncbi:MAG TPA: hypothetical protein VFL53_16655 [Pseudolabrys sp.]|nr:hypothetical protein [Pseudolabrys sp.]
MRPNIAAPGTADARPDWEAPAFTKLPIASRTGSGAHAADGSLRAAEPAAPGQPLSKLGFSFEWSLPMSTRN